MERNNISFLLWIYEMEFGGYRLMNMGYSVSG